MPRKLYFDPATLCYLRYCIDVPIVPAFDKPSSLHI